MSDSTTKSTRRAFFMRGGAALGTGVATTAAASALIPESGTPVNREMPQLRRELDRAADRDAIRQLHLDFTTVMEQQAYERVADLFDERAHLDLSGVTASGKAGIRQAFEHQYRGQSGPTLHRAYRQTASQHSGHRLTLSENGRQASATFHVEVQLCTPLPEDCTAAKMARLQGQTAESRWEAGRLEAQYVKNAGRWKMASLTYRAS